MKDTKLPLWYLASILIVIIIGIVNYMGLVGAIENEDIGTALLFQYLDFIVIGAWFSINIIMVAYLFSVNAKRYDFIPPLYFLGIHIFYIIVILLSNMGIGMSEELALNISVFTSGIEILLAGFYMTPYFKRLKEDEKEDKNIKVKKKRHK